MNTRTLVICHSLLVVMLPSSAVAHEMWVLTDEVIGAWRDRPWPATYTNFTLPTVLTLLVALAINGILVRLHFNGANELFPHFRAHMRALRPYSALVLRVCLSWVLLSSAMAVEPRFGNDVWSNPTLLAPDILISDLPESWRWLRWFEFSIGIALAAGVYVRGAAVACLLLVCSALFLTGMAAVSYAPIYAGVALYLLVSGGGAYFVPLPAPLHIKLITDKFESSKSISRAQFIVRVFAGFNFLFLAIYFKVLQPNLMLAIIEVHELPVMGLSPDVFVLIIAAVEVSIGFLVIFGILLRFLSIVLIAAFIFFAICLSDAETLTSHMLYYGVAVSFLFNGNGQWNRRQPTDVASNIIIIGNSISAVAAAQHLEKILPNPSNINLTLLSRRTDVQFKSLLPEVVSGSVQPNTLINPLLRVLNRTNLLLGEIRSIDLKSREIAYALPGGVVNTLSYDQLIVANDSTTNTEIESQTGFQGIHHLDSVVDAMKLKQNLLRCSFRNYGNSTQSSQTPISIAIYGGGERGSALAMEIHRLTDALKVDRVIPWCTNNKVILLETVEERNNMGGAIIRLRERHFEKRNIKVIDAIRVGTLCSDSVRLRNGKAVPMDIVVNLSTRDSLPPFIHFDNSVTRIREDDLSLRGESCVWMATHEKELKENSQRRMSMQLEQARLAAFNAWASSQGLEVRSLRSVHKSLYECYMGRNSVATWRGIALPGVIGWLFNRRRYLSTLPSLDRKLRIIIDWTLDCVFNADSVSPLEHDFEVGERALMRSLDSGNIEKPDKTKFEAQIDSVNKAA